MAAERRRQIEFPPLQTHVKSFEVAMIAISILCIVVVLVIRVPSDRLAPAAPPEAARPG